MPRSSKSWRAFALAAGAALLLLLTGCASYQLGEPVPSIDNVRAVQAAGIGPVALGRFALAPDKDSSLDARVSIRGLLVSSPHEGSFAHYLKRTLAADLNAAGLLDATSPVLIEALLTDSRLDVPAGAASASLAARFTVSRAGQVVYQKELRASAAWDAPFMGIVAAQGAIGEYGLLYRKLVTQLIEDPAFRAAARPQTQGP